MNNLIKNACMEVARANMWNNKPADATPMINFAKQMTDVGIEALEHFQCLGANEQDIADAIHYIEQVYALPPIRDNIEWFKNTLFIILEPAFPNGGVSDEGARFAKRLITGIKEQLTQ